MTKGRARGIAAAIGGKLMARREALGISRRQLSRDAGVNYSYISLIENGKRLPSIPTLYTMAELLGVEASWLLPNGNP